MNNFTAESLSRGDMVTMASPANIPPLQYRNYDIYRRYLTDKGFSLPEQFHVSPVDTTSKKVDLFNDAAKSGARAIFPVSGSSYSLKTMNRLDYDSFRENRPIFCTFSAASTLLIALHERSGGPLFYGPHLSFLTTEQGVRKNPYSEDSFWNMLMRKSEVGHDTPDHIAKYVFKWDAGLRLLNLFSDDQMVDIGGGIRSFVGERLDMSHSSVGGALFPSFLQSLKTCLDEGVNIDFTNRILMLESDQIGYEEAKVIISAINSKSSLEKASAIVFAGITPHPFKESDGLAKELYSTKNIESFVSHIRKVTHDNTPVVFGFPMGHGNYKLTIPFGASARIDLESGDITLVDK